MPSSEEEAAELGLTLPPGYVAPEVSIKSRDTLNAEYAPIAAQKKFDAKAAMLANWREQSRLRDRDEEMAVALGWAPNSFTIELTDWGSGLYGRDPDGQHRPVPQWSRGGRDTMNLIKQFNLTCVHRSDMWCVGRHDSKLSFFRRKTWLDPEVRHEVLEEAISQYIISYGSLGPCVSPSKDE